MSSLTTGAIVFALVFGGALFGMFLRAVLPEHHLSPESKDVIKIGMGLVATMAALVLSLVISSAKSSFDAQNVELTEASAKIVLLDRILAQYGPEAKDARSMLRDIVTRTLSRMWTERVEDPAEYQQSQGGMSPIYDKIQELAPKDDRQRTIQTQALNLPVSRAKCGG